MTKPMKKKDEASMAMKNISWRALVVLLAGCSNNSGIPLPAGMPQAPCVCDTQGNATGCSAYTNAEICPDLSPVQFCSRDVGSATPTDVIVSNRGLQGLVINNVTLIGDDNCAFDPPLVSPKEMTVIDYLQQEIVHLTYRPTKLANDYAILRIESTAENFPRLDIAVCGQGLKAGTQGNADGGACLPCVAPKSETPACGGKPDGGM